MTLLSRLTPLVRTSGPPKLTKSAWSIHIRRKQKLARKAKAEAPATDPEDANIDLTPYRESMQKTLDSMQRDLSTIRTSGAHPGILDSTYFVWFELPPQQSFYGPPGVDSGTTLITALCIMAPCSALYRCESRSVWSTGCSAKGCTGFYT
jgi:hypothetical protein